MRMQIFIGFVEFIVTSVCNEYIAVSMTVNKHISNIGWDLHLHNNRINAFTMLLAVGKAGI